MSVCQTVAEFRVPKGRVWCPQYPFKLVLDGPTDKIEWVRLSVLSPTERRSRALMMTDYHHVEVNGRDDLMHSVRSKHYVDRVGAGPDGKVRIEIEVESPIEVEVEKLALLMLVSDESSGHSGMWLMTESEIDAEGGTTPTDPSQQGGEYASLERAKRRYVRGDTWELELENEIENALMDKMDDDEGDDMKDDDDRPYQCNVCGKKFGNLGSFKTHWKRFHE